MVTLTFTVDSHTFSCQQGREQDIIQKSLSLWKPIPAFRWPSPELTSEALAAVQCNSVTEHCHYICGTDKSSCGHNFSPKYCYFCICGTWILFCSSMSSHATPYPTKSSESTV